MLERAVKACIIRLLPLTDDMGLALLADNSMRANLDIVDRLLALPDIPIIPDWKDRLKSRIPNVRASSEDRNRIAHNIIVDGDQGLVALVEKKGKRHAMSIDAATISKWAIEAEEHAVWFQTVPHAEYDLEAWEKRFATYEEKDWPKRPKPP